MTGNKGHKQVMADVSASMSTSDRSPAKKSLRGDGGRLQDMDIDQLQIDSPVQAGSGTAPEPGELTIGVVIINYNSGNDLFQCLCCLEASRLKPDAIVVVDNHSSDGSLEHCKRFGGVQVIRKLANGGYASAANAGVRALEACAWVAVLNPDVFVSREWLAALKKAIQKFPRSRAFASRMISHAHPEMLDGEGDVYHLSGLAWRHHHGRGITEVENVSRLIFSACGGAALYHRQTFLDLDGFDEDFFCYMEDVDLGWRLQLAGYDCIYVHEAEVRHIGSSTVGVASDFQIYHGHRNMVWTWVKNMPAPLLVICLPPHLLINLLTVLCYCIRGRVGIVLRAKRDALAGLPKACRKRRQVQALRARSRRSLWRVLDKRLWRARFQ